MLIYFLLKACAITDAFIQPPEKIMTLQNFSELEREIPRHIICRVHKSYMVAISKIDSIERDEVKIGPSYIPISDTYRKAFFDLLGR